mgnify:CR=1 FL=1
MDRMIYLAMSAAQQMMNGQALASHNLANANTVGFKASAVQFSDLVSQSVGGSSVNPMQVGLGVTTGAISPVFTQGGFDNTGTTTLRSGTLEIDANAPSGVAGALGNSAAAVIVNEGKDANFVDIVGVAVVFGGVKAGPQIRVMEGGVDVLA